MPKRAGKSTAGVPRQGVPYYPQGARPFQMPAQIQAMTSGLNSSPYNTSGLLK
ncbi:hypothetical protein [Kamptonema formosum]|uniref:hypothetical protein n=1 Tax=Kamptonema formosum TaxID=331992 RepID=UPI00034BB551|nr:hypothetical protein [Oscillatoria sp. PCC 10802]